MMPYADFNVCYIPTMYTHWDSPHLLPKWMGGQSQMRGDERSLQLQCRGFSGGGRGKERREIQALSVCLYHMTLVLEWCRAMPLSSQSRCKLSMSVDWLSALSLFYLNLTFTHLLPRLSSIHVFLDLNSWWTVFQEFLAPVGCRPLFQPTSATINSSQFPQAQAHLCTYIPMGIDFHNIFWCI